MSNYNRPIIAYGNSFYINIELKQFNKDTSEYEYFDITTCHDVKVNLICAQHNTVIPLQFELLAGYNYILKCFVDYRLLHTTSYGVMVEGLNADDMHWRWTMLPKEGLLVVNNTSGMNIPDDVTTVDLAGRVGWGIQTDADLTNYYTKTEVNTLLENVEVDLDDYYTKSEVDGKLDDKQETLESSVNIKTVNGESILGSGNIEIQGGGGEQVQSDWNETDTTSPAYIQNKPDIQSIEGNIADVQNDIDNLEDDIAAQQAEISGVQTAISGHQTALENNASEINGIQSAISGHQTAIENLDTEKQDVLESGVNIKTINNESILGEGNITIESGVEVEPAKIVVTDEEVQDPDPDAVYIVQKPIELKTINGEEIVGEGNIEVEADTSEIEEQLSGMQTVLAGHQTALENQSSVDPGFIKLTNPNDSNKVGLVSSLTTNYDTNIGQCAVIEGAGHSSILLIEATGDYSHAEGHYTRARGYASHAEGQYTTASSWFAHAEGESTEARGYVSHAEGDHTQAEGYASHAEGGRTQAVNNYEHASGQYNVSRYANISNWGDTGNTLLSVGNGTANSSRHNAFEVRQNGDIYYADTEKIDGSTVHYYDAPMIKLQDAISGIQSNISGMQSGVADVQNDIDNLEDDIAAQQAEISGVQTAISGHQTALESQATEITGMQTQISGHQTALESQATEISGIQSNISGMQTEISGIQTTIAGHQTAIQNQATEISGMQTVLAGHQTALENQSGGGPDYHIYVRWNLTSDGIFYFGIELLDSDYHYVKRYSNGYAGGGYYQMRNDLMNNYGLGLEMSIDGVTSANWNFEYSTITQYGFKATLPYTTSNHTIDYGSRITFDIYKYNGDYIDNTYVYDHYDIQIPLDKNALVTSTTTSGLKIEVVSALPSTVDQNTIYIVQ